MTPTLRFYSDLVVSQVLTPAMAVEAVRQALACHARGDYEQPLKPYLYPLGRDRVEEGGRFITMPARLGPPFDCAGLKHIAGFPGNLRRGLPRASGLILLNDIKTGFPVAVMDCAAISAARTAAVAALGNVHLGPREPRCVAIAGAGPIAAACIGAMSDLEKPPLRFRIYDLDRPRAERLALELSRPGRPPIDACGQIRECVEGADVLVTATTAKEPYIQLAWLEACRLVVALSFEDCEPDVILSSKLVVDDWEQCCREDKPIHRLSRSGLLSRDRVHAEFGEIVTGHRPGREDDSERCYLNPMGMAIEDVAVAWRVYQDASARGLGMPLLP